MTRSSILFTAAALAVAGLAVNVYADDNSNGNNNAAQNSSNTAQQPAADQANNNGDAQDATASKPAPAADAIRKTIATATEAALTKDGYDDLAKRFVDADRDRLKDSKKDYSDLDAKIAQFKADWKAKYNQDFNISSDRNNILGDSFARISEGEIGQARTASGKEEPSDEPKVIAGSADDLKKSGVNKTDANSNKEFGGDTNRESGRHIAAVIIPAGHGMPEVDVPMIREIPDSWKIDLPDSVDGQQLHDNLLKEITAVDDAKDRWPDNVDDAYREVTHHVMDAMFPSANPTGDQAAPQAGPNQ